jgi:hypothetical protein
MAVLSKHTRAWQRVVFIILAAIPLTCEHRADGPWRREPIEPLERVLLDDAAVRAHHRKYSLG